MSDKPDSDGPGYDPLTGIPRLPAAFRGRRRFSLRPAVPEPEPPDERAEFMSRARAWADDDVEIEPEAPQPEAPRRQARAIQERAPREAWAVPAREPVKAFLGLPTEGAESSSEPRYVYGLDEMPSSGLVVEDDELVAEVSEDDELPRLPVAGASTEAGSLELPEPSEDDDWPTETPPEAPRRGGIPKRASRRARAGSEAPRRESRAAPERGMSADFARGAADSLGASESPPVQFGAYIRRPRGAELGHTLAPRHDLEALEPAEPPPPDPRPSLDHAGRFPVRSRPLSGSRAPSPPPTQMPVPSPFHRPAGGAEPEPPVLRTELVPGSPAPVGAELPEPEPESEASTSIHLAMADLVETYEGPGPEDVSYGDEETHVFLADELPREEPSPELEVEVPHGPSLEGFEDELDFDEAEESRPNVGTLAAVGCLVAFVTFGAIGTAAIVFVLSMG